MSLDPEVEGQHNVARSYINNALEAQQEHVEGGPAPADFIAMAQVHATLALAFAVDNVAFQLRGRDSD